MGVLVWYLMSERADPIQAGNARKMINACKRMAAGEESRRSLLDKGWKEGHVLLVEQLTGMGVKEFIGGIRGEMMSQVMGWLDRMGEIMPTLDPKNVPKALETVFKIWKEMEEMREKFGGSVESKELSAVSVGNVLDVLSGKVEEVDNGKA